MNKRISIVLTTSMIFTCYMLPASADWGSLFEDLKSTGQSLLSNSTNSTTTLDSDTIISGLKEALVIGSRHAIENVSQPDGYLANELIHIAMPPQLQRVDGLMRQVGLDAMADQFEQSMNHAAEKAAPEATNIIVSAIKNMTINDAKTILNGKDDAATDYFKQQTSDKLTALFRPVITDSLNQVGTTKYYNDLTKQIAAVPFVGETVNLDLPDYVTQQALNGMFTMIAAEEKKIRENPAARTTELLKTVFKAQ